MSVTSVGALAGHALHCLLAEPSPLPTLPNPTHRSRVPPLTGPRGCGPSPQPAAPASRGASWCALMAPPPPWPPSWATAQVRGRAGGRGGVGGLPRGGTGGLQGRGGGRQWGGQGWLGSVRKQGAGYPVGKGGGGAGEEGCQGPCGRRQHLHVHCEGQGGGYWRSDPIAAQQACCRHMHGPPGAFANLWFFAHIHTHTCPAALHVPSPTPEPPLL
jgi:hypothetical protein